MISSSFLSRMVYRWQIKILCAALAIVLFLLYRVNTLSERQFSIPLQVSINKNFIISSEYPTLINLTVRGNEKNVQAILPDDIKVYIDLTSFQKEGRYRVPVEIRKQGTALLQDALEFRAKPREIVLSQEQSLFRTLPVVPEMSGFPASGYELTQFFVSPSSVTAVGPQSQMENLNEFKTEIINLSGRDADFQTTVRIIVPFPQIIIPGGEIVEFRGTVIEKVVIKTFSNQEIVVFDLPANLRIDGDLPKVTMTVQGSELDVEGAQSQGMTFYVDGSLINSPGEYTLPLKTDIPAGLAILQLIPREISISVRRATNVSETEGTLP